MLERVPMNGESDAARFERAVTSFIFETIKEQARESVYQGWLVHFLAQEFGWRRVIREVHVLRADLLKQIDHPHLFDRIADGKGFPPDIAIVDGDKTLDRRSSPTRCESVSGPAILRQLSIIAELKVMGAKKQKPSSNSVCEDFERLELWTAAAPKYRSPEFPLNPYLIILDNWRESKGQRLIHKNETLRRLLDGCKDRLDDVLLPTIIIGQLSDRITVEVIRD